MLSGLLGGVTGGLELAVDRDIGILVETGIGFETMLGLGSAFEDTVVVLEETDSPFDGCMGVVVLQGMGSALGLFDEFAVGYTASRPSLREMVGVELVKTFETRGTADNDVFAVFVTLFVGVHDAAVDFESVNGS